MGMLLYKKRAKAHAEAVKVEATEPDQVTEPVEETEPAEKPRRTSRKTTGK